MPNQLQLNGAQSPKPTRWGAIWTERFASGLWTARSPLRDAASTRIEARFYGARGDAFIDGQNVEVSNKLTLVRRPGNSVYNSSSFTSVLGFYEFRLFNTNTEQIRVMVDTQTGLYDGTGPGNQTLVWSKSAGAGQTYMQYVANVLYFGNGVDQKKWVQNPQAWKASYNYTVEGMQTFVVDANGNLQQLTQCVIPVTNIAVSGNVLTVTFNQDVSHILSAGLNLAFTGLANATFLNNQTTQTITITNVSGSTITAPFVYNNYASTADTGSCEVLSGGTPLSGTTLPVWSTSLMGVTTDNVCVWTNRGSALENFGIVGPSAQELTATVNSNSNSWKPNTYYSSLGAVIDSNGNLQKITTAGVSAAATPVWGTTVGATTTDGTVVWTMTQTKAQMTWQPGTSYTNGALVVATPVNGQPSVYELQPFAACQISGAVNAYIWPVPHTGQVGVFQQNYPLATSSASGSATGNSLLFDSGAELGMNPIEWATLDSSGATTGYTQPFPTFSQNYNMVVTANLVIPEAGDYTVTIVHHDGMIWGMGNGATVVSGPSNDPLKHTQTAVQGYTVFGGTNMGLEGGIATTDQFVVNFPAAGTYPLEIDYAYWYHSGQTLTFAVNGITPVPGTVSTTRVSGGTQPVWASFSSAYAPGYALSTETSGQLVWANIGLVSDFGWTAKTNYNAANTFIVDSKGYEQQPFEPGVSSVNAPTFSTVVNGLSPDNPNLTWINAGKTAVTPAGNINTSAGGWSYCIALVNTLTDTVSNAGAVTASTGSFVGASGVTLKGGLPAASAIDPQADYVAIFRTKDGGATYNLIPSSGNANQNTPYTLPLAQYLANGYIDTTPDAGLNILLNPALALENTPPPTGIINLTYHLNRVFGSYGNVVCWSAGPDAPIGNGNEGFPPANSATFPSLVKRIVPTAIGALVFTVSDIYLIAGRGTGSSPLYPMPYVPGVGILSYNALAQNGTTLFLFTTDKQFVALEPNASINQVGFPIGDQFASWDPSKVYVTWHVSGSQDQAVYVSNGSTGWFRLMTTPAPETGMTWCPFASIVGGCGAVQSVEVSPGIKSLLVGPAATGPVLKRDLTTWEDNTTPYAAFGVIGSIVLAQPGQVAELGFATTDSIAVGTPPTLSVRVDEISGPFEQLTNYVNDPPRLPASTSLYSQRFYFSQTQRPALCRHLQLRFDWIAENTASELLTLTLYGGFTTE